MTLRQGLEAASAILFIMTSPGIDGRIISEDAIAASIVLLRHNLSKNILPALNGTGHMTAAEVKNDSTNPPLSAKKRRRSGSNAEPTLSRDMKKVNREVLTTVGVTVVLMERFETLIQKVQLDDQHILTLSSGVMICLEMDPTTDAGIKDAHLVHTAAIAVLTSIFRKYSRHRSIIIDDLILIMPRMPTSKKAIRTFPVQVSSVLYPKGLQLLSRSLVPATNDGKFIQTVSALIMALVHSAVTRPNLEKLQHESAERLDAATATEVQEKIQLVSGIRDCQAISDAFVKQLLQHCAKKGEDGGASEFRPVLSNLIDDFLLMVLVPEFPAAEFILLSFVNLLTVDLMKADESTKALQAAESTYLNTAFDALGKICAAEARILAYREEKPIKLIPSMHNSEARHVGCYCQRKEFASRLMLDCDRCHSWFHGDCVGLARETVPEEWYCDTCQIGRIVEFERDRNTNLGNLGLSTALLDEPYCMRRLVIDYLSVVARRNGTSGSLDAYGFQLAQWISELEQAEKKEKDRSYFTSMTRLLEYWDPNESSHLNSSGSQSLNGMLQCMSDEGRSRLVVHLASTQSRLVRSFKVQMGYIIKLMSSETGAALRKLSVKAIEKVCFSPIFIFTSSFSSNDAHGDIYYRRSRTPTRN